VKEKLRRFMLGGGYALIIATVAIGAYYLVLEYAENWFDSSIQEVKVTLQEDGSLTVPLEGDISQLYIYWECDGGTVKPVSQSEEAQLNEQNTQDNSWYYCYTKASEGVIWDSADVDGNEYETATVRATVYTAKEDVVTKIADSSVEKQSTITLTKSGEEIKEASESRIFSNPVRKDSDEKWSQIYIVSQSEEAGVTLAYRTGETITGEESLVLCWSADSNVLVETDIQAGGIGAFTAEDGDGVTFLSIVNEVTCNTEEAVAVQAFLVESSNAGLNTGEVEEADRQCSALIEIGR
jgi:hypothetical protein